MDRLLSRLAMGIRSARDVRDNPSHPDTSETVNISALALLKMMRHAREGVPIEVMGLMLGNFIDDYTINVVDVFAMPQNGTSVTVESVDPVYQTKHMSLLKQTGRSEMVVGCVDVSTQQSFEGLHPRAIAVVVDPIQSVKGKVMVDAFRSINLLNVSTRGIAPTSEPRQTTSNIGHLIKPNLVSTMHGLGIKYYCINVNYQLSHSEQKMLLCLHKTTWIDGLDTQSGEDSTSEHQIMNYGNTKRKLEQVRITFLLIFRILRIFLYLVF
uniref:MPN domain-containing protein n=1 Tax=Heterorhabditis bacteriophora TaxID=37862 RepID=A0A1I7XLB7_HETBA